MYMVMKNHTLHSDRSFEHLRMHARDMWHLLYFYLLIDVLQYNTDLLGKNFFFVTFESIFLRTVHNVNLLEKILEAFLYPPIKISYSETLV